MSRILAAMEAVSEKVEATGSEEMQDVSEVTDSKLTINTIGPHGGKEFREL